ncbi:hypothetical protein HDU79_006617 [Rhizoclosmatium sp. JEL0117]|nr:hypothetical protein HDU79_006617 [Rhizoclosmatium sp. JEL0117]
MQIQSLLLIAATAAGVVAAIDPSVPTVGQQHRYRALPRDSNLALVPVDGSEFLAGQKFDIALEWHSEAFKTIDFSDLVFTINGKQVKDVIANVPTRRQEKDKKCTDGWFLLSEAAAVDKSMHPMDYDRGLADLLELDRTLKAVKALPSAKDTAIFLTADHAQGYDVYGSVDLEYFRKATQDDSLSADGTPNGAVPAGANWQAEQRNAIGVYNDAGWVDNVLDENGLPTKFTAARYRLAGGKVDMPNMVENFEVKEPGTQSSDGINFSPTNPLTRNPAVGYVNGTKIIKDASTVYVNDPHDSNSGTGLNRIPGNLPITSGTTVHTSQAVDLYCYGAVATSCRKTMDNTELFFLMANALGLGDKP